MLKLTPRGPATDLNGTNKGKSKGRLPPAARRGPASDAPPPLRQTSPAARRSTASSKVKSPRRLPRWLRRLAPALAGATARDRALASLGALAGVGLATFLCWLAVGGAPRLAIVAPVGASAVLLFAVPASPLAQPWPIVGGNLVSALVGLAIGQLIDDPFLAAGVATAAAIAAMSLARCLHPPGGAIALTSSLAGYHDGVYVLIHAAPIALTSAALVAFGWIFHRLCGRSYPHAPAAPINTHKTRDLPPQMRVGFSDEDIDAALADFDETFDIDREDLDSLLRMIEHRALARAHGGVTCGDVMSRDVIRIGEWASPREASQLLLTHGVRSLPVVDWAGCVVGAIGLRDLAYPGKTVADIMTQPATAKPDDPAVSLFAILTDGKTHGVSILDDERRLVGVVTQTDLLMAMAKESAFLMSQS